MINPYNWYWISGGNVFSSATQTTVATSNGAYLAWVAAGGIATPHPGDTLLRQALAPYGIGLTVAETTNLAKFNGLVNKPWLAAKTIYAFLGLMMEKGIVRASERTSLLGLTEATDQDALVSVYQPGKPNILINGGMDFFQRGTAVAAYSDDTYGPDRFYILTETSAINCEQSTGDTARFACKLTQNQVSSQRFGLAQILPTNDSRPMRNRWGRSQARIKISASGQSVNMVTLEHTGTADTVVSDVVNNWASGVFSSGGTFFFTSPVTIVGIGVSFPAANTWTNLLSYGQFSGSTNNIVVFIWTNGQQAQNVTLEITEVGFYDDDSSLRPWLPRPLQQELALCQRYYQRWTQPPLRGLCQGTTFSRAGFAFPTPMRIKPVPTISGAGTMHVFDAAVDTTVSTLDADFCTPEVCEVNLGVAATLTAGRLGVMYQGGSGYMDFNAEL